MRINLNTESGRSVISVTLQKPVSYYRSDINNFTMRIYDFYFFYFEVSFNFLSPK